MKDVAVFLPGYALLQRTTGLQKRKDIITISDEKIDIDKKIITKALKRLKRLKTIGIAALSMCLLIIFVVVPIANYKIGSGLTYSNLDEIYTANKFMGVLKNNDYEKAYSYLNIKGKYNLLIGGIYEPEMYDGIKNIEEKGFEWYDETCKDKYIENMKKLEKEGLNTEKFSYQDIYKEVDGWSVIFSAVSEKGITYKLVIRIDKDGITQISPQTENQDIFGSLEQEEDPLEIKLADYYC